MKRLTGIVFFLVACLFIDSLIALPAYSSQMLRPEQLAPIAKMVEKAIRSDQIPGAVVLIGNGEKIAYRRAFGYRMVKPKKVPMTLNTIFDVASLTKVIATTTAATQLVAEGRLSLEDPVVKYWPEFATNGKEQITVQHLLTHYSGLQASLSLKPKWSGYEGAIRKIGEEKPIFPPEPASYTVISILSSWVSLFAEFPANPWISIAGNASSNLWE